MIRLIKKVSLNNMFNDFLLNILASLIITIATQILVYPYLSRFLTNEEYGLVLTMMGIVNVIGVSLGNPLNNTRILMQDKYEEDGHIGDYNIIFLILLVINIIATFIISYFVLENINTTVLHCVLISSFILFRAYYSVSFRIKINYWKNLKLSIFCFIGYVIGLVATNITEVWTLTFLIGELFGVFYLIFNSEALKEKFELTSLFSLSFKKFVYLFLGSTLAIVITYMDRFYIYPFLGSEQVAIYNVASFLGKTVGIIIIPITGVLLTYYSKESSLSVKMFYKRVSYFFVITTLFYSIIALLGKPIVKILYPTLYSESLPYFYIANLIASVFIFGTTLHPILLRFCHSKWHLIIQSLYFLMYLVFGYLGMVNNGLMGFCASLLFVNIAKVVLMLIVTTYNLHRQNTKIQ